MNNKLFNINIITMLKRILFFVSLIFVVVCTSCEPEEDFGFPSRIKISSKGETVDIKGSNDLPPGITHIQVLDYDGNGNDSGLLTEGKDYIKTTTDWLTVKYIYAENKLVLNAAPNETKKNRKLYLYLFDGRARQEITVTQSK